MCPHSLVRAFVVPSLLILIPPTLARAQGGSPSDSAKTPAAADSTKKGTDSTKAADTTKAAAPTVINHIETALAGLKISGYGEGSYTWSSEATGRTVNGRLYDRFQDQFSLNALKLVIDKPYDATKWDAGVHADLLFGQNASVLQSGGFSLGNQGDMTQLYVTLNIPTPNGNGVQVKVGKIATLMGLEVIEDPVNPNWSEGNLFVYVENFTATGVSVEYKFSPHADMQLRLIDGWDVVQDNNSGKSFMGRVGIYPDTLSSIAFIGYAGPEEPASSAVRAGGEVLLWRKFTPTINAWVQADYGRESSLVPDSTGGLGAANWWGLGGWFTVDLSSAATLALRADYVDDRDGVRSSGFLFPAFQAVPGTSHQFGSGTATLNIKVWSNALVRPEVRFDHGNLALYGTKSSQVTFALATTFIY
jgi:hypothetical protein